MLVLMVIAARAAPSLALDAAPPEQAGDPAGGGLAMPRDDRLGTADAGELGLVCGRPSIA